MIREIAISTRSRNELVDITSEVGFAVKDSGVVSGICHIFVPHTTAGLTINENADPSVRKDMLKALDRMMPAGIKYEHAEGNSDSHIKAAMVGSDKTVFVQDGVLKLGVWQGIYFCEFDGPRLRNVLIRIVEG